MTDPNVCYAYFSVYDDALDPSAVSQELGTSATESWRKGDLDSRHRERKTGHWSLYSRLDRAAELEEHLHDVLAQMDANAEAFAAVSRRYGGTMQLVAYFHDIGSGLNIPSATVARLAFYGLQIDLDAYYLHSDARESTG